jgi:two-component system sensor histidine kinase PilS (NtrC family)
MQIQATKPESELYHKLKWLMFFRVLFTSLLLGSTIILQFEQNPSPVAKPLLILYGLIAGIFLLSFIYAVSLQRVQRLVPFAYLQNGVDTIIVSLIIFVTGGFMSIFSFLYLVVIIYSSMLLFRRGSMVIAGLCSVAYGAMIGLEYYGILNPYVVEGGVVATDYAGSHVIYKILITIVACFAVAFLSSILAEQTLRTKKELQAIKEHVKRVEKMAYMGEMAAGLAHEIKNPLASLAGSIQLLKADAYHNPDHEKLMQIVLRETDRLSSLVGNFLMFARPPAGRSETIQLDVALAEIAQLFEKDATCRGRIHITKKFAPDIWIAMDPTHLRQILWNLLLNASEAIADKGNIVLTTRLARNRRVQIEVADDGCGIPEEIRSAIFDPFFTTKPKGTGLGLSIVHRILEFYNSRLDVDSIPERGTRFTIKLPSVDPPT